MDTQETQSEAVAQEETAERSDLDVAREKAQQEVDAFLSNAEYDDAQKLEVITNKTTEINGRVDKLHDEMNAELDGAREQFKNFQTAGYDQTWLDKASDEIRQRYTGWQDEDRAKIKILTTASLTLSPNPAAEPDIEEAEVIETAVAEPLAKPEEVEAQDEKETEKTKIDTTEILQKMKRNQELAEDLRSMSARLRNIADVSPREPWFRPLQRFNEEFVGKLNNRLLRIIDDSSRLRTLSQGIENDDPKASGRLNELTDELNHEWRTVASILEDANHFISRLRRQTEELSRNDLDRDHPVFQIGSQLRRATEELNSRRNTL